MEWEGRGPHEWSGRERVLMRGLGGQVGEVVLLCGEGGKVS